MADLLTQRRVHTIYIAAISDRGEEWIEDYTDGEYAIEEGFHLFERDYALALMADAVDDGLVLLDRDTGRESTGRVPMDDTDPPPPEPTPPTLGDLDMERLRQWAHTITFTGPAIAATITGIPDDGTGNTAGTWAGITRNPTVAGWWVHNG